MKTHLRPTPLPDLFVVEIEYFKDERGFFIESWHARDFAAAGLDVAFVQEAHSCSRRAVLRGLHYQDMTAPMGKLVRCTAGAIYDVAVDLRVGSPTFGKWFSVELSAENKKQVWVPVGFGHGFQALTDGAEVQYKQTAYYTPAAEGTVRWDEPQLAIPWPLPDPILSERDKVGRPLAEYLSNPAFRYDVGST